MSTATITLEPLNIAASAEALKAEFAKANLAGVRTVTSKGAVHLEIPVARWSDGQFFIAQEQWSWRTPKATVTVAMRGFVLEQQVQNRAFHVVFRLPGKPSKGGGVKKTSLIQNVFVQRSMRAVQELQSLDEHKLAEAVQAPTDYSVLLTALSSEEALASIRSHDPLAGARLRGIEAKRRLVETEGGTLSSAEVAKALRITRQAVDKRRKEGKLLAVELGKKGYRYPAWQLDLPDLEKLLDVLSDQDGWQQLSFFLNPSALLGDRTPLEVLRHGKHKIGDVLRAASAYGEQGG